MEALTQGSTKVSAILDFYKARKPKWDSRLDRLDRRVRAAFGNMDYTELGVSVCEDYADELRHQGLAENTIRLDLQHLRGAVRKAAKDDRYESVTHAPDLYVPTGNASRDVWITKDEFQRMLEYREPTKKRDIFSESDFHVKLYLQLAIATAGRPSHILALEWNQVDWKQRLVRLRKKGEVLKTKRKATVPINDMLYEALTIAYPLRRTPYIIEDHGRPIKNIRNGVKAAAARVGLEGITPNVIRHSAATWMAMAGISMTEIAMYLGNDVRVVEKHYLHMSPNYLKDASDVLQIGGRVSTTPRDRE